MSYDENRISDQIDGGIQKQNEILKAKDRKMKTIYWTWNILWVLGVITLAASALYLTAIFSAENYGWYRMKWVGWGFVTGIVMLGIVWVLRKINDND